MTNKNTQAVIGIIGGSGVYDIEGLTGKRWERVHSPFGEASDELLFGELSGQQMVFLPRHGRGHWIPPSEINFRANIDALKRAGATDVISVSAVGSLRESLRPGMFVIVDQFIERTFARVKSFFGTGLVAHVSMAHPVCNRLGDHLEAAAREDGIEVARGGTYLVMEGPQFSSLAEAHEILAEDIRINRAMGACGAALLPDDARLTAWEMVQENIPVTLITDNMAGYMMSCGEVDAVVVGTDRVAANGDVANKIGTYMVAVLARRHGIPFYVACPLSTIDRGIADGKQIPIEERAADEVTGFRDCQWAAHGVSVRNPAFDVTPAELVGALITEKGVVREPNRESVAELFTA